MTTTVAAPILFFGCALLYWAYKAFRGPVYQPGSVRAQALSKTNTEFDDPSLYDSRKKNTWTMPGGMEIYYFEPAKKSERDIPTIIVHGGPGIAPEQPWKLFAAGTKSRIPNWYLYHARGCGHSTRPFHQWPTPGKMWPGMQILEKTLGIGAQIADIERIRRRLAVQHGNDNHHDAFRINLVGHSFGGFISTLYAAEFPQHVQSLVLMEPAGVMKMPNPASDLFALVRKGIQKQMSKHPEYLQYYDDWFQEYMDFSTLPQQTETSLAARQQGFAKHYDRATNNNELPLPPLEMIGGMASWATFLSMGIEHDYTARCKEMLSESNFSVTIVHGDQDLAPESISRSYCDLFPSENVTYKIVAGADHFLFDHPDIVDIVQKALHSSTPSSTK